MKLRNLVLFLLQSNGKLFRELVHDQLLFLLKRVFRVNLLLLQLFESSLQVPLKVLFLCLDPP